MKAFLIRILMFVIVFLLLVGFALFFIPNKKIENNSLYSSIDKHRRLDSLDSPKIVFVGGSNLAYGLNSKMIEDSLGIPVVNMGLHAGFGLKFMMNEVVRSIDKGDIVVLSPEYHHFYGTVFQGEKVLVALLVDVDKRNFRFIDLQQFLYLLPKAIDYGVSKLMFKQMDIMDAGNGKNYEAVYKRNSFNEYGDENMHWSYPNEKIMGMAVPEKDVKLNTQTFDAIVKFKKKIESHQAVLIMLPPAFQQSSYENYKPVISQIENKLKDQGTPFIVDTEDAAFPDSLFFNTIFHLNKEGVDMRSEAIISLFKTKINIIQP